MMSASRAAPPGLVFFCLVSSSVQRAARSLNIFCSLLKLFTFLASLTGFLDFQKIFKIFSQNIITWTLNSLEMEIFENYIKKI